MKNFSSEKKLGPFLGPFLVQNLAILAQKSVLVIFFETAQQNCLKLGQKLGTIALNHRMPVLCRGKILVLPFWPFWGQKF